MWLLWLLPVINLLLLTGSAVILAYRTRQTLLKWFALSATLVSACGIVVIGKGYYDVYLNANPSIIVGSLDAGLRKILILGFFLMTCLFLWFCVKAARRAE